MAVHLKRAYEPASPADGERYLVERLWPRGVKKVELALTAWLKDLAPSTELRRWYGHDVSRWAEFSRRYRTELQEPERRPSLDRLATAARGRDVTLVFAARDPEHSSARILQDIIESGSAADARP